MDVPIAAIDIFRRALIGLDEDLGPPEAEATGWAAIHLLHRMGSREVLDVALSACAEPDALRRRVGASILGQLGHTKVGLEPVFEEERYQGLMSVLMTERSGSGDPAVLADVCFALGHLRDRRAIPVLIELRTHPDPDVRRGVVAGLSGHVEHHAIEGLVALSEDSDDEVRDWATFGLGQLIQTDTPLIRTTLHARIDDPNAAVRCEAIEGLASRGDRSVLSALIRELQDGVGLPLLTAAIALATPELCEALAAARRGGLIVQAGRRPYDLTEAWAEAMHACRCCACGATTGAERP